MEEIERYEEAYKVLREAFEDEDLNLCDGPNTARRLLQAIDTIPWESGTAFLYTHYLKFINRLKAGLFFTGFWTSPTNGFGGFLSFEKKWS